jgi:hypothetical protein
MTWYVLLFAGIVGIVIFVGASLTVLAACVALANWRLVYQDEQIHYLYRRVVIVGLPLTFWGGVLIWYFSCLLGY